MFPCEMLAAFRASAVALVSQLLRAGSHLCHVGTSCIPCISALMSCHGHVGTNASSSLQGQLQLRVCTALLHVLAHSGCFPSLATRAHVCLLRRFALGLMLLPVALCNIGLRVPFPIHVVATCSWAFASSAFAVCLHMHQGQTIAAPTGA